jgi:hypothetical protein
MGMDLDTLLQSAEHTDVNTIHKLMPINGKMDSRLVATRKVPSNRKIEKIDKNNVLRKAAEIKSQSIEDEEDGFIEKDCSIDWVSPPIYDTYPDKEVSSTHQVDFFGVDAIADVDWTYRQSIYLIFHYCI